MWLLFGWMSGVMMLMFFCGVMFVVFIGLMISDLWIWFVVVFLGGCLGSEFVF